MASFHYRVLQTTWGISVKIDCQVTWNMQPITDENYIEMTDSIYLASDIVQQFSYTRRLFDEEINFLRQGILLVSSDFVNKFPNGQLVIKLTRLDFADTDYQPEGLTYAIAGWLGENFGFSYPKPIVKYDKATNRYLFPNL